MAGRTERVAHGRTLLPVAGYRCHRQPGSALQLDRPWTGAADRRSGGERTLRHGPIQGKGRRPHRENRWADAGCQNRHQPAAQRQGGPQDARLLLQPCLGRTLGRSGETHQQRCPERPALPALGEAARSRRGTLVGRTPGLRTHPVDGRRQFPYYLFGYSGQV